MTSHVLILHGERFLLDDPQALRLRRQAGEALAAGGELVEFAHQEGTAVGLIAAGAAFVLRSIPEAETTNRDDLESARPEIPMRALRLTD